MNDPIEDRVIRIIARRAGIDAATVVPTATLQTLGVASFHGIEMTFEIEDDFDINVPVGACDLTVGTVEDMVRAVREALAPSSKTRSSP
ncbi:phosphopantetheine-binding protein [Luteibacter aegosomatis]|uniref:acyl carrier protein n=1 Tax=Luteibacter aegosomatis TaxID=2911537 RepID=UPI001FF8C18D|nr:phosphopantetheine-binding protein [Luteibacter aegosomatis]UPG83865.1 phosphopantetheine-binding protein [Luteibacter aegosomatis]